jgi:hypothetical protein
MQQVETDLLPEGFPAFLPHLEHRHLLLGAHLNQVALQTGFDPPARHDAFDRGVVGLDGIQLSLGAAEDHVRVHPHAAGGLKDVIGQIHHLLGGATALDRCSWMGEQGRYPMKRADRLPGGGDVGVGVVADDAMATESLRQALDLVPVELETHGHNQQVVAERFSCRREHPVGLGLEGGCAALDPGGARRDHGGLRAVGFLIREQTSAGQDPT